VLGTRQSGLPNLLLDGARGAALRLHLFRREEAVRYLRAG